MDNHRISAEIAGGRRALGIELGSTRIKSVLIGSDHMPVASGNFDWENRLENGFWTYRLEDVWAGLRSSYQRLTREVKERYGVPLTTVGSIGISAMMHGYLAFDESEELLVPFRTWRNTTTGEEAARLTELFGFNIPLRWSIAHLEQASLGGEAHVPEIRYLTTLSGYVHWKLTGQKVLGIGDASGMFPIDSAALDFDAEMVQKYNQLAAGRGMPWKLKEILPRVLCAGEDAGALTEEGARLLDAGGQLQAGILLCPPEGDAGTGMAATNSVSRRTGNVSAGTSIFAMIVLEQELGGVYPEIDMVTTPCGDPVAMVHCNNCTSDLDAWVKLFGGFAGAIGAEIEKLVLYDFLYRSALEGDSDCGGLLSYNYFSGEPVTDIEEGRLLLVRSPDGSFTLPNLMRCVLFSALGTLRLGLDILFAREEACLDELLGHGGLFKTPMVGQRLMAAATGVPVSVMETAGEGGAWGIALLAAYMKNRAGGETREDFDKYMERYARGLPIERMAAELL